MEIASSETSPYVRKIRVLVHDLGIEDEVTFVPVVVRPTVPNFDFFQWNPLGKIPALRTDDGQVIVDSPVIAAYLDRRFGSNRFHPNDGFWSESLQAMADGVLDAAVALRYEQVERPRSLQWEDWVAAQTRKIVATLDYFERFFDADPPWTIGTISVACVLGYLDFRFADLQWRLNRPRLALLGERWLALPALVATRPKTP